jgi:hypothetical protein
VPINVASVAVLALDLSADTDPPAVFAATLATRSVRTIFLVAVA